MPESVTLTTTLAVAQPRGAGDRTRVGELDSV